ncbi:YpdA family putative bacillithiol disulfide reductase [Salipaludibacillus agaradhaerens]|uniref:YpdA family putative bacillithiol disulfide reductase n=1 Tax=Salipaludibacillus agaradhaerens TaxID=76935 RepID=A0A9Q4B1Q3_SALAG|nr:YpdA family putative bacillithiol disulfide reductase [Salipaludibacillus agaradhaerens]MCR6096545.1 YpdA family putative bacillithiol disulfide reductase [Salipaludibacillus agaradhaerens]MCR6113896.1 YpdA family putative bacillithiol disulfide reductase [Salipaludibacillus agaradhaerens]
MVKKEDVLIVGAGPCGLSAAIELQNIGYNPLIIERGNIVHSLFKYPTHQQFFSSSDKLAIGGIPFYSTERKPKRNEALVYYREVVKEKDLRIKAFEEVLTVRTERSGEFIVETKRKTGEQLTYLAKHIVIATGYYDSPNFMNIPGENLPHVYHYFHEAHTFFNQKVVVIGGKNSAVDAALELEKAGAEVTVVYRGEDYSQSIKPWILPEFDGLVKKNVIKMHFNTLVCEILPNKVVVEKNGEREHVDADFVFAMTGYHPDHSFIEGMGVKIDRNSGRPTFDKQTMETNIENIYIAGVIAAGNNANEIFIENGREHGKLIAHSIGSK